jgi:hypothetical protein
VQTKFQLESRTKIEFVKQFVEHIFPAQSTQNWATAAASELENGSRLEDLRIRKEGLEWNPYYSATDVKSWQAARLPASSEALFSICPLNLKTRGNFWKEFKCPIARHIFL